MLTKISTDLQFFTFVQVNLKIIKKCTFMAYSLRSALVCGPSVFPKCDFSKYY